LFTDDGGDVSAEHDVLRNLTQQRDCDELDLHMCVGPVALYCWYKMYMYKSDNLKGFEVIRSTTLTRRHLKINH